MKPKYNLLYTTKKLPCTFYIIGIGLISPCGNGEEIEFTFQCPQRFILVVDT